MGFGIPVAWIMSILRSLVGHFAGLLFPPNFAGLLFPPHFAGLLLPLLGLNTASRAMNRLLYSIIISLDPPFYTKHKFFLKRQRKDQRPFFARVGRGAGEWLLVHLGGLPLGNRHHSPRHGTVMKSHEARSVSPPSHYSSSQY